MTAFSELMGLYSFCTPLIFVTVRVPETHFAAQPGLLPWVISALVNAAVDNSTNEENIMVVIF